MSSERWRRLDELFARAQDLREDERRELVLKERAHDPELARALEDLLRSHDEAGSFLGLSPTPEPSGEPPPASPLGTGSRAGPYRLGELLGQGGMSTVYRARRADGAFDREVAVKVIRRGLESEETLERLRAERQILASLDHPYIARLYDGGQTEDGLPYFVLEEVDGLPVDEHSERHDLGIDERVDLFRKICEAVSYAHQRLVIHRDLKPSNILVTEDGVPKLLDFGIAKLLEEGAGDGLATAPWARRLTPQYASPEQVRGEPATTATDVYSLGVLLYRLLVGREPYELAGKSLPEIEKVLSRSAPPRPSEAVAEVEGREAWSRHLAGDLDNILRKALESDSELRYASVDRLADDLDRYRRGLPVLARRPTFAYRAGKLLKRHRLAAAAVALILALGASQVVSLGLYAKRVTEERNRAEEALASQREVTRLAKDLFQVAAEGEALTVGQAVERVGLRLDRVVEARPELGAELLETAGTVFLNLGEAARAREMLERAARLQGSRHGEASLERAETLSTLGAARVYSGDGEGGVEVAREALSTFRRELPPHDPRLVKPLNNLVLALCRAGGYPEAVEPSRDAQALASRALPPADPERARAASNRAVVVHATEGVRSALPLYREALRRAEEAFGAEHPETTAVGRNLALLLRREGELEEAEALLLRALEGRRRLSGAASPEAAEVLRDLGRVRLDRGDPAGAEEPLQEARRILRQAPEYGPAYPLTVLATADLAEALNGQGRPREAQALLEEDLPLWRRNLAEDPRLAYAEGTLGESYLLQGRRARAEPLLRRSLEILLDRGEGHPDARRARRRVELLETSVE